MTPWRTVFGLAAADLRGERTLALCNAGALAAVLAPLVVLAGLRHGVVEGLRELLLENPHAREIVTAANRSLPADRVEALARRPDVQFVVPLTRTLSTTLFVQSGFVQSGLVQSGDAAGPTARLELVPTRPGDPLLSTVPTADDQVVLSAAAAARLHAGPGATLTGRAARIVDGNRQSVSVPLTVAAVAPPAAFAREAAFVTLPFAVLIEDWQEAGVGWPPPGTPLPAPQRTEYAGFRLYARQLGEVPALDAALRRDGFEISSRAGEVRSIEAVDGGLGALFDVVAGLGGAGFLLSLGAGLWANVERKRVHLALLRFLGFRRAALAAMVAVQAVTLAVCGAAAGVAAAFAAATGINVALAGVLALHRPLCVISPSIVGGALAATVAGAVAAAALACVRAGRVEPWEGVSTPP